MPLTMDRKIIKDFPNYSVDVDEAIVYRGDKPLKASDNGKGYLQIVLSRDGKRYDVCLHHLVYCAKKGYKLLKFKDRLKERGQNIHHKNSNPKYNAYSNLELVSNFENLFLKKIDKLPFSYIHLIKNDMYLFKFPQTGYSKSFKHLKDAVRFRNLYLALYFKADYKEVKRIERKYSKIIRLFLSKYKLSPKYFI